MKTSEPLMIDLDKVSANLRVYLCFLKLLESLSDNAEDYKEFIHPEVEFLELPNLLNKTGQIRNLAACLEGVKKAKTILAEQQYKIVNYIEGEGKLVFEKIWTGRMSIDIRNLKAGQELKAYICAVVEFRDGKIFRHRTYDCYEPF